MCGIAGYVVADRRTGTATIRTALDRMRHRGPDDEGFVLIDPSTSSVVDVVTGSTMAGVRSRPGPPDPESVPHRIGLGHRRFALVDPGPSGHQPFTSRDGSVRLTWNGEIYNYIELRRELEVSGHVFATPSDTEVFVNAYLEWGTGCFERFIGFWAAALYDSRKKTVLLSRDRVGKAPLYTCRTRSGLYWASELGALRSLVPETVVWSVRTQSVVDFLYWGIRDIDGSTFYDDVATFPAASYGWVDDGPLTPVPFWRLPDRRLSTREISADEAAREVRTALTDAVRIRLRADVPIGVQISGGLDSSSILALTAGLTDRVAAYTVAFDQPDANEEPFARAVAERHSKVVDYRVLSPPMTDPAERMAAFVELMGEPFHSPNQITNHFIWKTIRDQGLRGVLYGAGGDEVFAGYPAEYGHPHLRWLLRRGRFLETLREFAAFPKRYHDDRVKDLVIRALFTASPAREERGRRHPVPKEIDPCVIPQADRTPTAAPIELEARLRDNFARRLIPYWTHIDNQNSMGVPIELRCPFLDHRVVELGFQLPIEYLIHRGWTKWILRRAIEEDLPDVVTWRRHKMGFPFPLQRWLIESADRLVSLLPESAGSFINPVSLDTNYGLLNKLNPEYLWKVLALGLWSTRPSV